MKLTDFLEEAAIMKEMKHPNLVQVVHMICRIFLFFKCSFFDRFTNLYAWSNSYFYYKLNMV